MHLLTNAITLFCWRSLPLFITFLVLDWHLRTTILFTFPFLLNYWRFLAKKCKFNHWYLFDQTRCVWIAPWKLLAQESDNPMYIAIATYCTCLTVGWVVAVACLSSWTVGWPQSVDNLLVNLTSCYYNPRSMLFSRRHVLPDIDFFPSCPNYISCACIRILITSGKLCCCTNQ
jgi:hypothetical protein